MFCLLNKFPKIKYEYFQNHYFCNAKLVGKVKKSFVLSFVNVLLEDKQTCSYTKVFETVIAKAQDCGIFNNIAAWVITDFELGLKNITEIDRIRLCLSFYVSLCIDTKNQWAHKPCITILRIDQLKRLVICYVP